MSNPRLGALRPLVLLLPLLMVGCMGLNSYRQPTSTSPRVVPSAPNPARPDDEAARGPLPLDDAVAELAQLVAETLPQEARSAVYPPTVDGETTALSSQLATELETEAALATHGQARIITRSQLSLVLDEQNLQVGDLTQPDTQVRVGQMLGATHIVTGSMATIAPDTYRWTLQVIDLTDGTVLGGTRQEVVLDNRVYERAERGAEEPTAPSPVGRTLREFVPRDGTHTRFDPHTDGGRDWRWSGWGYRGSRRSASLPSLLLGTWQVDGMRASRELRANLHGRHDALQFRFTRDRLTLQMLDTGERMRGRYAVADDFGHSLQLRTTYADGTDEECYVRFLDDDRIDLFPDGSPPVPLIRVE